MASRISHSQVILLPVILPFMLMWAWIAGLVAYTQNSQYSQVYYPPIPSSTPQVRAWLLSHGKLQAITQPQAASFPASAGSPLQADLDGDGLSETLRLAEGNLEIIRTGKLAWQSPESWQVTQVSLSDLNHDARTEVTLLVWRPFRPWPVDRYLPNPGRIHSFHDAVGQSCHLILIGWKERAYRELWAGSALADPLRAFAAADLDGDGFQELIALEAAYEDPPASPARTLTAWEWNGFGFTLLARVNGSFQGIQVLLGGDGQGYVVTEE